MSVAATRHTTVWYLAGSVGVKYGSSSRRDIDMGLLATTPVNLNPPLKLDCGVSFEPSSSFASPLTFPSIEYMTSGHAVFGRERRMTMRTQAREYFRQW